MVLDVRKEFRFLVLVRRLFDGSGAQKLIKGIDAGGPRSISQLGILKKIMTSYSLKAHDDQERTETRPCDVFAAIGGTGTGG